MMFHPGKQHVSMQGPVQSVFVVAQHSVGLQDADVGKKRQRVHQDPSSNSQDTGHADENVKKVKGTAAPSSK